MKLRSCLLSANIRTDIPNVDVKCSNKYNEPTKEYDRSFLLGATQSTIWKNLFYELFDINSIKIEGY